MELRLSICLSTSDPFCFPSSLIHLHFHRLVEELSNILCLNYRAVSAAVTPKSGPPCSLPRRSVNMSTAASTGSPTLRRSTTGRSVSQEYGGIVSSLMFTDFQLSSARPGCVPSSLGHIFILLFHFTSDVLFDISHTAFKKAARTLLTSHLPLSPHPCLAERQIILQNSRGSTRPY